MQMQLHMMLLLDLDGEENDLFMMLIHRYELSRQFLLRETRFLTHCWLISLQNKFIPEEQNRFPRIGFQSYGPLMELQVHKIWGQPTSTSQATNFTTRMLCQKPKLVHIWRGTYPYTSETCTWIHLHCFSRFFWWSYWQPSVKNI